MYLIDAQNTNLTVFLDEVPIRQSFVNMERTLVCRCTRIHSKIFIIELLHIHFKKHAS